MGNTSGKSNRQCNSKTHPQAYFFLCQGYHVWEDESEIRKDHENVKLLKEGQLKKRGTKSKAKMTRMVSLWSNRLEYSMVGKDVVGFLPTFGAELDVMRDDPLEFRLRDGYNKSEVQHRFVAASAADKGIWVKALSQAIKLAKAPDIRSRSAAASAGDMLFISDFSSDDDEEGTGPQDGEADHPERVVAAAVQSGDGGSAEAVAANEGVAMSFAVDLPPGEIKELSRDQFRVLRASLGAVTGVQQLKQFKLTPVDRPFYIDTHDHRVWLDKDLYGRDSGEMKGGDPEAGPHPASILFFVRKTNLDSPCLTELETWKY